MDLLHRIIAMEGDKVVKVECLTCRGHHNYRRPKSAAAEPRSASPRASSSRSSSSVSPRKLAAAEVERQREASWEKTVAGRPITSFKAYRARRSASRLAI